jgi:hypothetical protein
MFGRQQSLDLQPSHARSARLTIREPLARAFAARSPDGDVASA